MVKYPQLAIRESVVDHACIVKRIFLAVVVDQLFVDDTGNHQDPREGFVHETGGINIPSHVHHEVSIINPLKFN
jgi:hypothetical protein